MIAAADFAVPIRGWILLDDDEAYNRRVIDLAADLGAEHVQLSHNLIMHTAQATRDPDRAGLLNRLIDRAHGHGLKAFVWTHELDEAPEGIRGPDGRVNLEAPELAAAVRRKYRDLFRALPAVDGVVLTLSETAFKVFDDGQVSTSMSKPERVTRIVETVHAACRETDPPRALIVRDWGNLGAGSWDDLESIRQGIAAAPDDVVVMTKITAGNWYLMVRSPLIGAYPGRLQIAEFDLCGEHHGQQNVPWCAVEYLHGEFRLALSRGIGGVAGRVDRMGSHALGKPGEINLAAFARWWRDPAVSPDRVWSDWAEARYGRDAAPWVIAALQRTHDIVLGTYYVKKCYFLQDHSCVAELDYVERHLRDKRASRWDPAFEWIEKRLLDPNATVLAMAVEEKDEAIRLAEQALGNIERAGEHLAAGDREDLRGHLERLHHVARIFRAVCRAYFAWRIGADAAGIRDALAELDRITAETVERYGEEFILGIPGQQRSLAVKRLRLLAGTIRERRPDAAATAAAASAP